MVVAFRRLVPGQRWPRGAASCACKHCATSGKAFGKACLPQQARELPHLSPQFCDGIAASRHGHPNRTGAAGTFGPAHDPGIHACPGASLCWCEKPTRLTGRSIRQGLFAKRRLPASVPASLDGAWRCHAKATSQAAPCESPKIPSAPPLHPCHPMCRPSSQLTE